MKRTRAILIAVFCFSVISSEAQQKSIAITIDDVPNTRIYAVDGYDARLLKNLDFLNIPFTAFFNTGLVYKTDSIKKNLQLLEDWCAHPNSIIGNHTYSHSRYSDVGFESFEADVRKGEEEIKSCALKYGKELKYFRFPYNDMGSDARQHAQVDSLFNTMNYISAPFTVESSDWMFNAVYEHYLRARDFEKVNEIGKQYVRKTIELIQFYESLSMELYNRPVHQIYLCHDNMLNADYLKFIITELKNKGYEIISLDKVMEDPAYSQTDHYDKKWGISWFYRWMDSQEERVKWMSLETDFSEIEKLYEEIQKH